MMWRNIFSRFIAQYSGFSVICENPDFPSSLVKSSFREAMFRLCGEAIAIDARVSILDQIWNAIMVFDGSDEDYQEFITFYSAEAFWHLPVQERLSAVLWGLLQSPAFYLEP